MFRKGCLVELNLALQYLGFPYKKLIVPAGRTSRKRWALALIESEGTLSEFPFYGEVFILCPICWICIFNFFLVKMKKMNQGLGEIIGCFEKLEVKFLLLFEAKCQML